MVDWVQLIRDVGFPIVITLYILIRLEAVVTKLSNKITELITYVKAKLGGDN